MVGQKYFREHKRQFRGQKSNNIIKYITIQKTSRRARLLLGGVSSPPPSLISCGPVAHRQKF